MFLIFLENESFFFSFFWGSTKQLREGELTQVLLLLCTKLRMGIKSVFYMHEYY